MTSIRELAFWARDRATGGRIRAHLSDITMLMDDHDGGRRRERLLASQLRYVRDQVPFYRDQEGELELANFPVVNKTIIREKAESFVALGVDRDKTHIATTSGSTGTPFRLHHDLRKRRRIDAEAIYWGRAAGYRIGNPLYHLKVWTERNQTSRLSRLARNVIPVDTTKLDDEQLQSLLDEMSAHARGVSIISYSSTLELLAKLCERLRIDDPSERQPTPQILSIIGQSEALSEKARHVLHETLNCDPVARYGLEELGIVAQQVQGSTGRYRVNRASFVVEILREDDDVAAAPGELGRIVVTDLFNRAQPLVRFDTGDLGAFDVEKTNAVPGEWLQRVEGRRLDRVYDTSDRPLGTMFMYNIWWRYPEISQYQFVQQGQGRYLLRINAKSDFSRHPEIVKDLKIHLGDDAKIDIEVTDEEFVLSSGKRKSVVSNYAPLSRGDREI